MSGKGDLCKMLFMRPAIRKDMAEITRLVIQLKLDHLRMYAKEFFVVRHFNGFLVGCARLKSLGYDFYELASVGVHEEYRKLGVGWNLVSALVHPRPGVRDVRLRGVWAICEKKDYNFFARQGFLPCQDWFWPRSLDAKIQQCGEQYGTEDLLIIHYGDISL